MENKQAMTIEDLRAKISQDSFSSEQEKRYVLTIIDLAYEIGSRDGFKEISGNIKKVFSNQQDT